MSKNDAIILESIIGQRKIPELSDEENFELFSFEQVLKDYDLSDDELINGRIGDGIGFFNFINDELIDEDKDMSEIDIKKVRMTTFLILAKQTYSSIYTENIIKVIRDIFDFHKDSDIKVFRNAYLKLVPRELMINIVFVSKESEISSLILQKIENFKKIIMEYIPRGNVISRLINSGELIILAHKERNYTLQLRYDQLMSDGDAYFILSNLTDYGKFITDEDGKLRKYIFDSNVRDFQKTSEVNKGIEKTLRSKGKADFWWLNNGIAILAKNPIISKNNVITLDDVQIVNGLQTTYIIYKYLKTVEGNDKRKIGIKVVTVTDNEIRDDIIKAASSQNPIPKTSLRANDDIQRNIESYLLNNGWFYDRRKNYYKNMRKPTNKIISIGYLAQAIMSMVYREPNRARRNPVSLTKDDKDYYLMFGLSNFKIFLYCIENMKRIDSYVRGSEYGEQYKTNLKWHLSTLVMVKLLSKKDYTVEDIESNLNINFENNIMRETMRELVNLTDTYLRSHTVIFRTLSTTKEFVNYIIGEVKIDTQKIRKDIQSDLLSYKNM